MGILRITYKLLEDFLKVPEDHIIVDIYATAQDREDNEFRVKISGPTMPLVREDEPATYIACIPNGKNKH